MLALRNSKPTSELDALSVEINARILELPILRNSHIISTYLHIGSEVRTRKIVDWALSSGKSVIVPITDPTNKRLVFSEVKDPEQELEQGNHGIFEPKPEFRRIVPLEQADVVLIPGVAWDRHGYRIGYGAGYYDRSINALRRPVAKIGLAYKFQLVPRVPRSHFDRRVERLATETAIIETVPNSS